MTSLHPDILTTFIPQTEGSSSLCMLWFVDTNYVNLSVPIILPNIRTNNPLNTQAGGYRPVGYIYHGGLYEGKVQTCL